MGFSPHIYGRRPFDAFLLPEKEWEAFAAMYDPPPALYSESPDLQSMSRAHSIWRQLHQVEQLASTPRGR